MNAAQNPFRSERVTALPFVPQGESWAQLLQRFDAMGRRGAVVGPCGTGKTTLLEELEREIENWGLQTHFLRLDTTHKRLPASVWSRKWTPHDAILLDGAEQLSLWNRRRFLLATRRVGALVWTSHQASILPTWLETTTSPPLLRDLAARLGVELTENEGKTVFEHHNGNVRECFFSLYDRQRHFP